jgi:hypothetical protein
MGTFDRLQKQYGANLGSGAEESVRAANIAKGFLGQRKRHG